MLFHCHLWAAPQCLSLARKWLILWAMRLRLDLLEHLTADDILEEVLATNHRFRPEPLFSKTGIGSLSPASIEERAKEVEHSMELTRKLEARARKNGKRSNPKS